MLAGGGAEGPPAASGFDIPISWNTFSLSRAHGAHRKPGYMVSKAVQQCN